MDTLQDRNALLAEKEAELTKLRSQNAALAERVSRDQREQLVMLAYFTTMIVASCIAGYLAYNVI